MESGGWSKGTVVASDAPSRAFSNSSADLMRVFRWMCPSFLSSSTTRSRNVRDPEAAPPISAKNQSGE